MAGMSCMPCSARSIPLSVDSLFRIIDGHSRTLKLKSLYADGADAGISVAESRRLPVVGASLSVGYLGYGYLTDRDFSGGTGIHNPHSNNNFAIEAMQLVYDGGAVSGAVRMAELKAHLSRIDLEQSRQQVRILLLGWLVDMQCVHNRRGVLDENISLARRVLDDMKARYSEGVVLHNDITRYELYLQELELQRDKLCEQLKTINYKLANALGFPGYDTEFIPSLRLGNDAFSLQPEHNWQETALMSNLLLKKASLAVDMSKTDRKIISAGMRPKLSLFAYGRFDSPIVIEVPVLNKNFMYWGAGLNVSFDLSSFYTTKRRVRRADIGVRESMAAYETSAETVRNDVREAYAAYNVALKELATKEKSLQLARQNYDVVNRRYAAGLALVTEMLDAANVKLSSETDRENAAMALLFSCYRLKYITNTL